jgi:protein-S-isoprenylcysteine O-methyltransferase Ste14
MANWLQKILTPPAVLPKGGNLPAQRNGAPPPQALPNATVIYGIGASLLFVAAFFLLLAGRWFPALAVFALGCCLTGFALHLLKHQD